MTNRSTSIAAALSLMNISFDRLGSDLYSLPRPLPPSKGRTGALKARREARKRRNKRRSS